jgi:hypothetical protein
MFAWSVIEDARSINDTSRVIRMTIEQRILDNNAGKQLSEAATDV